ncbi:cold-shock protein [Nostoc flagelliforme]|uniref:cold-shock protein n=1 Tax=Nostoc flagelliforme TaxID=1306274 RepID=UPI001F54B673|nr:cold shock domain-containing protein [Nostoc flagelliforme]
MKPALHKGQLIRWKDDRGFGFIQADDGSQEVFLHITELKGVNRRPQVGDLICYQLTARKDGKVRAFNASIEGVTSKLSSSTAPKKSIARTVDKSISLVLKTLLLSLLPGLGSIHLALTTGNPIPLILYPVMVLLPFGYMPMISLAHNKDDGEDKKILYICANLRVVG